MDRIVLGAGRQATSVNLLFLGLLNLPSLVPCRQLWGGKRPRSKGAAGFLLTCRDAAANDAAAIPMHAAVSMAGLARNPIYIPITATVGLDLAFAVVLDAYFRLVRRI